MNRFKFPILCTLHDEHMSVMALLERLEVFLSRNRTPPVAGDVAAVALYADLAAAMENEISHHYAFEEQELFPRFIKIAGDGGIASMLLGEHDTIRPVAAQLAEMARMAGGISGNDWNHFRELGIEMVEREVFHIQKEEMGFLPAMDQMLPPSIGPELEAIYAAMKKS